MRLLLQYIRRWRGKDVSPETAGAWEADFHAARREQNLAQWLVTSALLASYLVLLAGISYSEISGWNAILYWYLSGAYPVMIAFEVLAILFLVQNQLVKEPAPVYNETE